jgi:ABC-type sugar transport system permease subunit
MWQIILGPNIGMLTPLMQALGLGFHVLAAGTGAVLAWMGLPMVIYLAGLQNGPEDLTDTARIDGAHEFQTFWYVTFPLLATNWGQIFAGVVLSALPLVVAYLMLTRQFVAGLSAGAIKG